MAPAIAHFLVGASLLLTFCLPFCLRSGIEREYGLWLIPLGGIWGIAPDLHNIAPVFVDGLYAIHNSPLVDLFGLHYTLDRPIIRQQYLPSVFGSILVFCLAIGCFWVSFSLIEALRRSDDPLPSAITAAVSTLAAAAYGTLGMAVVVGLQNEFSSVALLVGSENAIVGGLLLVPLGLGLGVVATVGLKGTAGLVDSSVLNNPRTTTLLGGGVGVVCWLGGVVILLPLWLRVLGVAVSVPYVHLYSLLVCGVFGIVFGGMYGVVRGVVDSLGSRQSLRDREWIS